MDRLCCLVVRVPGYWSRGPGFDSRRYQIFWEAVGLGPLSLVSAIEQQLGRNSSGSGLESREYGRMDPSRWPRDTLYPQKFALTSPTIAGHSVGIVGCGLRPCSCFWLDLMQSAACPCVLPGFTVFAQRYFCSFAASVFLFCLLVALSLISIISLVRQLNKLKNLLGLLLCHIVGCGGAVEGKNASGSFLTSLADSENSRARGLETKQKRQFLCLSCLLLHRILNGPLYTRRGTTLVDVYWLQQRVQLSRVDIVPSMKLQTDWESRSTCHHRSREYCNKSTLI
jgi:hypothetical protein